MSESAQSAGVQGDEHRPRPQIKEGLLADEVTDIDDAAATNDLISLVAGTSIRAPALGEGQPEDTPALGGGQPEDTPVLGEGHPEGTPALDEGEHTYVHATSVGNAISILESLKEVDGKITVELKTNTNDNVGGGKKLTFLGVPSKMKDEALQYFGNQYGTVVFHFKRPLLPFKQHDDEKWATYGDGWDGRWSKENSVIALLKRCDEDLNFHDMVERIDYEGRGEEMDTNIPNILNSRDIKNIKFSYELFLHAELAIWSDQPVKMILDHIQVVPHAFEYPRFWEKNLDRDESPQGVGKWRCVNTFKKRGTCRDCLFSCDGKTSAIECARQLMDRAVGVINEAIQREHLEGRLRVEVSGI